MKTTTLFFFFFLVSVAGASTAKQRFEPLQQLEHKFVDGAVATFDVFSDTLSRRAQRVKTGYEQVKTGYEHFVQHREVAEEPAEAPPGEVPARPASTTLVVPVGPALGKDPIIPEAGGASDELSLAGLMSTVASEEGRAVVRTGVQVALLYTTLAAVHFAPNLKLLVVLGVASRAPQLGDIWTGPAQSSEETRPLQVLHKGTMTPLARLAFCAQIALCDNLRRRTPTLVVYAYAAALATCAALFARVDPTAGLFLVPSLACALAASKYSADLRIWHMIAKPQKPKLSKRRALPPRPSAFA